MTNAFEKLSAIFAPDPNAPGVPNPFASFTIGTNIVQYPAFCQALKRITNLHQRGLDAGVAGGLLVTSQTGSGKTTLFKFYKEHFPVREESDRTVVPVLLVITPESPSITTLTESILRALGDPAASKGTAQEKTNRIYRYLKECKVELLLVDEFQHFYDSKRLSEAKKVTDWLKNLFNIAGIPVVLAGLPRAVMVLRMNPQLKRRFASPFYLKPFGFDTDHDKREFRGVLKAVHGTLPLHCPELHDADLAQRFYYATHGLFDYLKKIIDRAVWTAGEEKHSSLTLKSFAHAFEEEVWRDVPKKLNPFLQKSILRQLNKNGEPFEIWDDPAQYVSKKPSD